MNKEISFDERPFFLNDKQPPKKENQVFVILPFKNTIVFEKIIKPILSDLELTCKKADDIKNTCSLMQDIANSIQESSFIIADLTGKNSNVFYELGLAHAFRKRVILLTQSDDDIPTDLKAYKYYKYDISTTDGIANFEETLKKLKENIDTSLIVEQSKKIYEILADYGNEEQINSNFLKQEEGTVSIWVYLDDSHINPPTNGTQWNYIMSHATNKGNHKKITIADPENKTDSKEITIYPNVWAIGRGADKNSVYWRFTCNSDGVFNEDGVNCINIKSTTKKDKGWHLFSIIWSKNKNFIKFYIDDKIQNKAVDFEFWPNDFAEHVFIGTWPNKFKGHYLNTKMGNWVIYENAISHEKLKSFYESKKPDKA